MVKVAETPAKAEPEPAPVIRTAVQEDAAPAPRIQTVAGPVVESKIRFNDLVTAVLYRDAGAVNDLLAFGKWPDKTDSSGLTPLMVAAQIGETAIALISSMTPTKPMVTMRLSTRYATNRIQKPP